MQSYHCSQDIISSVLVSSGWYNKSTIDWTAYKQEKFISHCSECWEIQDKGFSRFGVLWRCASWFIDWHRLTIILEGGKGKRDFWGLLLIRAITPFLRFLPSWPNHDPKAPCPTTITLKIRFQYMNLERHKHLVCSTLLPLICDNVLRVLPNWGIYLNFGVQSFYWNFSI